RAVAALGPRPGACRPRVPDDRRPRGRRAGAAGARWRGPVVSPSERVCVSLALAVFAAETGQHLVAAPRSAQFAAFWRSFDDAAYRARLAEQGLRFLERLPPLLAAI